MKEFLKTVKLSLRYKWTLALSVVCALLIGVLWGFSITAVYPFMKVIFEGQTAKTWLAGELERSDQAAEHLETRLEKLRADLATAPPAESLAIQEQIDASIVQRDNEHAVAAWYRSVEQFIGPVSPDSPFATLLLLMVLLLAATIIKGVCLVLNVVLVARVAEGTVKDLRRRFYRATLEMDQKRLDELGTPNLSTQLSHSLNMVGSALRALYGQSIREPLKMIACLIGAGLVSWQLLLISLIVVPFGMLSIRLVSTRMRRAANREMGGLTAIFHTLIETLQGIKVVKAFNRERTERRRFKEDAASLYRISTRMAFYDSLIRPITEFVGVASISFALVIGGYLVLNGGTHLFGIPISGRPLTPTGLLVFYAMLAGIADPARKMSDIYMTLIRGATAAAALNQVFDVKPTIVASENAVAAPLHSKSLRLANVTFGYLPRQPVLRAIDIEIPFGQTVAVLGENGCGKTSLVNLVMRFYDPDSGAIFLDDVNLRDINPKKIRRQIGLVSQDSVLFQGTIWENIHYGAPCASREQILEAAAIARVDEFIPQLQMGYETSVGDRGNGLSGGQRQRVSLARAVLTDPRIVILDEATSQIDQKAEFQMHETLRRFLKGRTTIMITHRHSMIELADRVIVMHRGQIVTDCSAAEFQTKKLPAILPMAMSA